MSCVDSFTPVAGVTSVRVSPTLPSGTDTGTVPRAGRGNPGRRPTRQHADGILVAGWPPSEDHSCLSLDPPTDWVRVS